MTRDEFNRLVTHVFEAFPSTGKFLRDVCVGGDVRPTLETWFRTLERVTFTEAMDVLAAWIDGSLSPPEAYERDKTALVMRSQALFARDKQARARQSHSMGDEYRKVHRDAYRPIGADQPFLADIYRKILPHNERFRRGEIDEAQLAAIRRELANLI